MIHNKITTIQAKELFKDDNWYQPMLFFSQFRAKNLTIDVVKKYLDSNGIKYELDDYSDNDNYGMNVSSTNQFDLRRIYKKGSTHFYTDIIFNKVRSVSYMDHPPFYQNEIKINIEHNDGWIVDIESWEYFLKHRFDEVDIQELRGDKLTNLLEEDVDENMAKEFNFNLIRHLNKYNKRYSNSFTDSVYDFYKRKGYITDNQLNSLKKIMYSEKGYMY